MRCSVATAARITGRRLKWLRMTHACADTGATKAGAPFDDSGFKHQCALMQNSLSVERLLDVPRVDSTTIRPDFLVPHH
jgi:hypothetical protein